METLNGTASHSLTIEVVSGWGGVYVQSCAINGAPLPAAIVPHDVLQVTIVTSIASCSMRYLLTRCSHRPLDPFPTHPPPISESTPMILQTVAQHMHLQAVCVSLAHYWYMFSLSLCSSATEGLRTAVHARRRSAGLVFSSRLGLCAGSVAALLMPGCQCSCVCRINSRVR